MRALLSGLFLSAILLSGCLRHGTCAEEPENRFCVDAGRPDVGPRADAGRDAGMDAGFDASVDAGDSGSDAGPCDGVCSGATPVCGPGDAGCVECAGGGDCEAPLPACVANTCVECDDTPDCDDGVCDTDTNACVECVMDDDCPGGRCNPDNTCVECLVDDDCEELCRDATVCSGTVRSCEACTSDADCAPLFDCIPTEFDGASDGSYCLPRKPATGPCPRPFSVEATQTSVDGRTGDYCGINQSVTTCGAVRALQSGDRCSEMDPVVDCPRGGLCRDTLCTYQCGGDRNCLDLAPGNVCNDATTKYCE